MSRSARYLREYRTFLERRPAFFWELTESWLNTGPSQPMALGLPADESITIDGETARDGFEGLYFPDLDIELRASGEAFDRLGSGRRIERDRPYASASG